MTIKGGWFDRELSGASWFDPEVDAVAWFDAELATAAQAGQYAYAGTGGLQLGGAATLAKSKVYTASGGLQLGGTSPLAKTKVYTASGGLQLGGTAGATKTKAFAASGGLQLGGAATRAKTKAYPATGLVQLGGVGATSFVPVASQTFTYVASGGLQLAGAAATQGPIAVVIHPPQGGGNTFAFTYRPFNPAVKPNKKPKVTPRVFEYEATGGLKLRGEALIAATRQFTFMAQGSLHGGMSGAANAEWWRYIDVEENEFAAMLCDAPSSAAQPFRVHRG